MSFHEPNPSPYLSLDPWRHSTEMDPSRLNSFPPTYHSESEITYQFGISTRKKFSHRNPQRSHNSTSASALLTRAMTPAFTVAIIDTGIDLQHDLFEGKVWHNPRELPDGLDNDGNGFVDDLTGWDFVGRDPIPNDTIGHGTQMAGLVAQAQQQVQIMPLKVIDTGLGGPANIATAIDYAVAQGANLINLSLNSPQESPLVETAINGALEEGVLVIAAAGNKGIAEPEFPANLPGVIAVGASNSHGALHDWSSGPGQKGLEFVAANVNRLTTADLGGGLTRIRGTSAAAAWISGQIAGRRDDGFLRSKEFRFKPLHAALPKTVGGRETSIGAGPRLGPLWVKSLQESGDSLG